MTLQKLIRPSPEVLSRLHDRSGSCVSAFSILTNLPRSLQSRLALDLFNRQPNRPWLSYNAVNVIEKKLRSKPCRVLEFGSGASTRWFADRAAELHSVENDDKWYAAVMKRLDYGSKHSASVYYEFQSNKETYTTYRSSCKLTFDVILIDGPWRLECAQNHANLLAPGGLLYLDNSDAETSTGESGELAMTLDFLNNFSRINDYKMKVFTDFAPCVLHATQGVLIVAR